MKPGGIILAVALGLVSAVTSVSGRPVDLSAPSGELGAANAKGNLEIWREVDDVGIDFGKGSFLPLRYRFSSGDDTGGILGPGFYMPMLEARSTLIREQVMRAYLPCGKGLYLWQDSVDSTKFMSPDKEWTGSVSGDDLTVWRDDGWTIVYHLGQLSSIRTDEGHVFNWDYDLGTHMATGISKDGQALATVERNEQGLLGAVVINGKRFEMTYAQRPLTQILLGQPAIKELALALSGFKYPDGKNDTFKFVLSPQLVPSLAYTDLDQKQTTYTWDVATSHLATEQGPDGSWTYRVGEVAQPFGSPPISRTNPHGQTEGIKVDNQLGIYSKMGLDGMTTVTHVFETPGPLYHKVQKVDRIEGVDGKDVATQIYRASYDEAGKLIRKIDENNIVTTYKYDPEGNQINQQVKLSNDPAVLAALVAQEKALLVKLKNANGQYDRMLALNELMTFYIFKNLNFDKAKDLLNLMTDRDQIYDLKVFLAISNPTHTADQRNSMLSNLIKEFPDKRIFTQNLMITKETK